MGYINHTYTQTNTRGRGFVGYLVVADEVEDGVKAHVVYQIIFGLAAFRLGVNTTVVVFRVTPEGEEQEEESGEKGRGMARGLHKGERVVSCEGGALPDKEGSVLLPILLQQSLRVQTPTGQLPVKPLGLVVHLSAGHLWPTT